MSHTQGKLALEEVVNDSGHIKHLCPVDADGLSLLTVVEQEGVKFAAVYTDEDAKRFVACWNALVDLPQDALDGGWTRAGLEAYGVQMQTEVDSLRAVNAELLEALAFYSNPGDYKAPFTGGLGSLYFDCGSTARAAIANARKGE